MIVIGKGVTAVRLAQHTIDAADGLPVTVFDGTPSNPAEAVVPKATAQHKDTGCDRPIAIGGGSSTGLAKGVTTAAMYPGLFTIYATIESGSTRIIEATVPLIAIPTTAGMESEVARDAIIILEDDRRLGFHSWHLLPKSAICNAEPTSGLLPTLTAVTGMGAITHYIETFLAPASNPPTDDIALDGLEHAWTDIERATRDGIDYDARLNMMSVSMQGVMAFQKSLGCVHSLSHPLGGVKVGGKTGLYHGALNAVVLPTVLCFNETAEMVVRDNRYARMRRVMSLPAGADLAQVVHDPATRLSLPTDLRQMGASEDALKHVVEGALLSHYHKANPRVATADDHRRMLTESM